MPENSLANLVQSVLQHCACRLEALFANAQYFFRHPTAEGRWSLLGRSPIWLTCTIILKLTFSVAAHAQTNSPASPSFTSQLIEFSGRVEVSSELNASWHPAETNQWLHPGDTLRTGPDSRAMIQLSDRSVIRVNQSSLIQIRPPAAPARRRFSLKHGILFFLNREKPSDVEFETPVATGAIRGTEFLLSVSDSDGATVVSLVDGEVDLKTATNELKLTKGNQVAISANGLTHEGAILSAVNLVQWSLYYPAVLNPAELPLSNAERKTLSTSLTAYSQGDLLQALAALPSHLDNPSHAVEEYVAAVRLAVGRTDAAEQLTNSSDIFSMSLRELLVAVRFEPLQNLPVPTSSSGWLARSYYLQSRSKLPEALNAARRSAQLAPDFGFAWTRDAELESIFGNRRAASIALKHAEKLSSRNAQNQALEGFLALDEFHPEDAVKAFDRALELDGSLPSAWVGRGLAYAQMRDFEQTRRDLQAAAALEPGRGLFRSYLGKAWAQQGLDSLAEKDFTMAKELDSGDPTAWLYSALHHFQMNEVNESVRELQKSAELNDNRSVFRSRLKLDQDQAVRSADLAALYETTGLKEVGESASSLAVARSYTDFSGHLFRAQSLAAQEDPENFNLRLETARESELLVANLLAPPGGGNLSQVLSQADRLQYFDPPKIGFSSLTGYDSGGNWSETATAFGTEHGFSYALDGAYVSQHGQRTNNGLAERQLSIQTKYQIAPSDSLYVQAGYLHSRAGDLQQHYDPASAVNNFRVTEEQAPGVFLGWHHEWSPENHTLFLVSRIADRLTLTNPQPNVVFLRYVDTGIFDVVTDPTFGLQQDFAFTLYSAELQQIWETTEHTAIVGARYQHGMLDTESTLTRAFGATTAQGAGPAMDRVNGYAYYEWHPSGRFQATAGLSYDQMTFPLNLDLPPVSADRSTRRVLGPKAGFMWEPWRDGWFRGAATRSMGGLFFDNSVRLEPTEVAGMTSAFRSLIPESSAGLVPAAAFNTLSIQFDQRLKSDTYFGFEAEWLKSDGARNAGELTNSIAFPAFFNFFIPDSPTTTKQWLNFQERNFSAYAAQLLGENLAFGARYRLSEARLNTRFTDLSGVPGAASLDQNQRALLNHVQLFVRFNHSSGFFAQWWTDWFEQNNYGYTPALSDSDFWQHNVAAGYRFPHRRAEFNVGILNLNDRDYRLNPLNLQNELARRRTFFTSMRLNF